MKKKQIPFIIGLGQKATQYRFFSKYFKIIQPDWNNGSISKLKLGKPDTLIGFSLGAEIACEHALKNKIKTLILCSMTPGMESLKDVKADKIILLAGEKEKWLIKDAKRVLKTFKNKSEIIVIPGADHKIDKKYLKKLLEIVRIYN
jgi:predicted esterase